MTFGTKRRSDWNGQDNAAYAVGGMLAAEMRAKRVQLEGRKKMAAAAGVGLVIAFAYLLLDLMVF